MSYFVYVNYIKLMEVSLCYQDIFVLHILMEIFLNGIRIFLPSQIGEVEHNLN